MLLFSLFSVLAVAGLVHSRSSGPPASEAGVCDMLQPGVGPHGPNPVDAGNGGFMIATNLSLSTGGQEFYTYNEGIRYAGIWLASYRLNW